MQEKNNEGDDGGIYLSKVQYFHSLLCLNLSLVMSASVLTCPQAACLKLQAIHSLWLSPSGLLVTIFLPCWFSISTGPTSGSFNNPRTLLGPPPPACRGDLWCHWECGIPRMPLGERFSLQGRWWECFCVPSPLVLVCPRLFSIMHFFLVN